MNEKLTISSGGMGMGTTLFLIFLVLKLTSTIDWSWWWVSAPLWIPVAAVLGIGIIGGILFVIGFGSMAIYNVIKSKYLF